MIFWRYIIFILAYIGGLLLTGLWGFPNPDPSWQQWTIVILLTFTIPFGLFIILNRNWRRCPPLRFWFFVSLVAFFAVVYFQLRLPSPKSTDISYLIKDSFRSQKVQVLGKNISEPRITSNNRKKFWLKAQKANFSKSNEPFKTVTGKLYLTLPTEEINSIFPHTKILFWTLHRIILIETEMINIYIDLQSEICKENSLKKSS